MKTEIFEQNHFPDDYKALADTLEQQNMFLGESWFKIFLNSVPQGNDQILWLGVRDSNDAPILIMPLWRKSSLPEWKGYLTSLANYYTTLFLPIHNIKNQDQLKSTLEILVESICKLNWAVIDLYPLDPSTPEYQLLISAFRNNKKHVTSYFMYGNWYLLTQSQTFQDYLPNRPGRLRNTLKRKSNKLKDHLVEYRICQKQEDVQYATAYFQETYSASWKHEEPYPQFIPNLIRTAANKGWLRLGLLFIDQQIAAAQLWLVIGNTAYIYKLCQKPGFDAYSPGSLLTAHLMEHVLNQDHVGKVDFLSGDDQYKQDWMSHRAERWGLQIANPSRLYGLWLIAKNELSNILKRYKKR